VGQANRAAEVLALAILQLHSSSFPQMIPVDIELVRLISAWREQRDIIDGTVVATAGTAGADESEPSDKTISEAQDKANDLAKQIWARAKAETWSGGRLTP
jgi:hypothetical protein